VDPFTIMAGASAAYNAIKQGIAFGKELHDMGFTAFCLGFCHIRYGLHAEPS
jgi:hydrogenase/urease accessory protein HupE